jgi:hypothetical protein
MGQNVRLAQVEKPKAYWETIRERIDTAIAATNINKMANGEVLPAQQERISLFIVNKMLPNLQAVAVEITHKSAASMDDLTQRAEALGLDPALLLGRVIEGTAEVIEPARLEAEGCQAEKKRKRRPHVSGGGTPRDQS